MNDPTIYKTAQHNSRTKDCCTESECASGLRNNYFEGKRLTADSFRVEQKYLLDRRHLLNRAIHGWGVVYGYAIKAVPPSDSEGNYACHLKIGPGLALDKCGRELLQEETSIRYGDVILLDQPGTQVQDHEDNDVAPDTGGAAPAGDRKECWLLSVHYAEQDTAHVRIEDRCRCEHDEWDHTCETVRFSLQRTDCEECCDDFDCELKCDCATGECCDDAHMHVASGVKKRGGCQCLCSHLTGLPIGGECNGLCDIKEPCGGNVRVDLRNGVPLACVTLISDQCGGYAFSTEVNSCGPRRLVKRNDLLFDLIRGCDLTRIDQIGWDPWHRREDPISFDDFKAALSPINVSERGQAKYTTEKFWVRFSKPVRKNTLLPDCFAMTILFEEGEGGWWQALRVPILAVNTEGSSQPTDPPDTTREARIVVDGYWVEDAVISSRKLFNYSEARVELEIRGDFIVDCNGQTIDANADGRSSSPTGNGTPGGTFLSTFRVGQREAIGRPYRNDDSNRQEGVS